MSLNIPPTLPSSAPRCLQRRIRLIKKKMILLPFDIQPRQLCTMLVPGSGCTWNTPQIRRITDQTEDIQTRRTAKLILGLPPPQSKLRALEEYKKFKPVACSVIHQVDVTPLRGEKKGKAGISNHQGWYRNPPTEHPIARHSVKNSNLKLNQPNKTN